MGRTFSFRSAGSSGIGAMCFAALVAWPHGASVAQAITPDPATLAQACPRLSGMTVPAVDIGLPSGAATIVSTTLVPATPAAPRFGEYCKVLGTIAPLTAGADPIRFQINLPTTWNAKAVMVGGGGFNGTLIDGVAPLRDSAAGQPHPITQGFATFGTDSGHNSSRYLATDPGRFALNDEMFLNFAHQAYKKVRDVAQHVMSAYYLRRPAKQYFYGGSEGGREGLTMAQRYPQDFDGIVSFVPVIYWTGLFHSLVNYTQPQFNGGALNAAKIQLLAQKVMEACDALDGIADGVVSNYLGCANKFDLQALRCSKVANNDTNSGDSCLSDLQLSTLKAAYESTVLPFAVANGSTSYPGRLYGGEIQPGGEGIGRWLTNGLTPSMPPTTTDGRGVIYSSSYVRYVIARDADFDIRSYKPESFRDRIQTVSALMDSSNPDLSAFFSHGGKLIIQENAGDMAQSPLAGIQYYQSVVAKLGQAAVDQSMRLYVSPASSHAGQAASLTTGKPVPTNHDMLSTLDQWTTSDIAPANALIQVRNENSAPFSTQASRPLCQYPGYPHYVGGSPLQADSYRCRLSSP